MKKLLIAGGAMGALLGIRRCVTGCGRVDFEQLVEWMPDGAPPKWMLRNITAIRENTERILERLDAGEKPKTAEPADD